MKFSRLTREERYQISALLDSNLGIRAIARILKRPPSTVSREVRRNTSGNRYIPKRADNMSKRRRKDCHPPNRLTGEIEKTVCEMLNLQFSPQQISGRLRLKGIRISHETIYKYVHRDFKSGGQLYRNLRRRRRWRYSREGVRRMKKSRKMDPSLNIRQRPEEVEQRLRLGDYERDSMQGIKGGPVLLTIVDRTSRLTKIAKVEAVNALLTHKKTILLLQDLPVHTITNDNGSEFASHRYTAEELKTSIYFSDPYASWQRGTNENTNGLIRQYFSKGTDLSKVTDKEIQEVENKLNNRPRKVLGFRTPLEVQRELSQLLQ